MQKVKVKGREKTPELIEVRSKKKKLNPFPKIYS